MNKMKVSVIVPLYNLESYICDTLNSIINQDFEDFEIIVVDDGSRDRSLELARKTLESSNIPHTIIHQENHGVSHARNRGIEAAAGEYLVFVDGDDIIGKNHLKELYKPEYDFSLIQLVKKDGDKLSKAFKFGVSQMPTREFIKKELLMEMPFNFCQVMYKTSIIKENNITFPLNVVYGEDTYFALKSLIYSDKIAVSDEVTYFYTQHSQSAINTSQLKRFEIVEVFEKLKKDYDTELSDLITTSRIPRAIFGNMNYFFFNNYDFSEVMDKMAELDLFDKLSKFKGDFKFSLKIKLFLLSPKTYYKMWMKFKNSID